MAALAGDWASKPLNVIQQYFKEGRLDEVRDYFTTKLSDTSNEVPLLSQSANQYLPPDGTLVKYRGMVQDQFDPEFYLKVFSITSKENGVTESYVVDYESARNITGDRQTLYAVPIPGETRWIQEINGSHVECDQVSLSRNNVKRTLEDDECEMDTDEEHQVSFTPTKKQRTHKPVANGDKKSFDSTHLLHHPLPNETRISCLVKMYDNDTLPAVNSLIEFIGILSTDPLLVNFEHEEVEHAHLIDPFSSESLKERRSHHPPPSLVPRLHCIFAVPLSHSNPLLPLSLPPKIVPQNLKEFNCDARVCRDTLLDALTNVCHRDQLAAEYILLHLLSSVYGRTEVMALGKFALNISNCPAGFSSLLYQLIQDLVEKCHHFPLTLSNLNSITFVPFKDYSDNRLHPGLLQLSKGTHLLVDELAMTQGQLNEKGVANLKSLGSLVKWQKVKYDFKYHQQDFDADIPVLITSEGKSIINVDCHVPLQCMSSPSFVSLSNDLPIDVINQLRCYMTLCCSLDYQLQPDIQKHLEEDFIRMRRRDSKMNGETFHHLLCLARLVAISNGEPNLSVDDWEHAKQLHVDRVTRLS